jgi:hypothetical protein
VVPVVISGHAWDRVLARRLSENTLLCHSHTEVACMSELSAGLETDY